MLQRSFTPLDHRPAPGLIDRAQEDGERIDLEHLLAAVRRQFGLVAICVILFVAIGIYYIVTAVSYYTASTRILLDQNTAAVLTQVSQISGTKQSDETISSQVELLKSEKIGLAVVDALDLTNDQDFMSPPPSLIGRAVRSAFGLWRSVAPRQEPGPSAATPSEAEVEAADLERRRRAARMLAANLYVERMGPSFVISVSYISPSPERAAAIAGAYAQAYLRDQLDAKYDAMRRASDWLQRRIQELRQLSTDADLALQRFRSQHNVNANSEDAEALRRSRSRLRELETEATSYQALYDSFLQKYQESVQQQTFPITEARVITDPIVPGSPTYPRTVFVLGFCILLGGAIGTGLGAYREFRDRFFRTGDQIQSELNLEPLGIIPRIRGGGRKRLRERVLSFAANHQDSEFAEALRGAKLGADLTLSDVKSKVIGVVSVLPGEGKSTVAANFALLLASQGERTLLIDADLRNPGLTRAIAPNAKEGLADVLYRGRPVDEVIRWDEARKLAVLPGAVGPHIPHSGQLLASPGMASLLHHVSKTFDYVIVDLPPIAAVFDVRAFASRVHGFLLVVEWGRTARRVVGSTLRSEFQVYEKCIGVLLNRANLRRMKLYRSHGSKEYYRSRVSRYHS